MKKSVFIFVILAFLYQTKGQNSYHLENTPTITPASIPYFCDFEDITETSQWVFSNSNCENKWYIEAPIGLPSPLTGNCLFVSSDLGVTNNYLTNTHSTIVASRTIVSTGSPYYLLNFDIYIGGNASEDFLKLYITDEDTFYEGYSGVYDTPYYGTSTYGVNEYLVNFSNTAPFFNGYFGINNYSGIYVKQIQISSLGPAGTIKKIIFVWHSEYSAGNQPGATIDNISLITSNCPTPTNLTASNIQENSVQLTWTENGNATAWDISYKKSSESIWTTFTTYQNPCTISGLSHSTYYDFKIKADCVAEQSAITFPISARTLCGTINSFPWIEGFESNWETTPLLPSNTTTPNCWININGDNNITKWQLSSNSNYHSGTKSAQHYSETSSNVNHDYLISPVITLTGNERLRFWMKGYGSYMDYIKVGIYDIAQSGHDLNSISDTILIDPITSYLLTDINLWTQPIAYLNNHTGNCRIVFIRDIPGNTYMNIDDIIVETIPNCPEPISSTEVLDTTSITISWIPFLSSQTSFYVYYKTFTDYFYDSILVIGTQYTIPNLTPNSKYDYYLRSVCGTELSSPTPTKTITTLCNYISSLPYTDNFDTYGTNSISFPTCWFKKSTSPNYPAISTTNYSTPASIYFVAATQNEYNYLISPKVSNNIPIHTLKATFRMRGQELDDSLFVGVMIDPQDINTFIQVGCCHLNTTGQFEVKEVFFNNYIGTGHFIALKSKFSISSSNIYLDNFNIDYAPICLNPTNLSASNISDHQVTIHWNENDTATGWNIQYGLDGFLLGTGTILYGISSNPYIIPNLTSYTTYQVYVQSICGNNVSPWSQPITFTTDCSPIVSIPWSDLFDTYGTTNYPFPTCWKQLSNAIHYPSVNSVSYSGSGSLNFNCSVSGYYNIAITPKIDNAISFDNILVNFKFRASGLDDTLYVGTISNPLDTNSFELISKHVVSTVNSWEDREVFLWSYSGSGRYIAFKSRYGATSSVLNIDNVVIDYISNCPRPSNITASNTTSTQTTITWNENGNAVNWELEYGSVGFTQGTGTLITGITNTFTNLINLIPLNNYQVYIRSICGTTDTSNWSIPYTFTTACLPIQNLPWSENFDTYGTGGSTFPTCWIKNSNVTNRPYISTTYFSAPGSLFFSATSTGQYNIAVTPQIDSAIAINSISSNFKLKINNIVDTVYVGVMSNPTDTTTFQLVSKIGVQQASVWYDKYVSFNSYTGIGKYIAFKFKNSSGSSTSGNIDNVVISFIPNCPNPIDLQKTASTSSSITIGWTETGNTTTWDIEYGSVGFTHGAGTLIQGINSNPYTISGLYAQNNYQIYVRSYCGASYSDWSSPIIASSDCGTISHLPWNDSFDYYGYGTTITPTCWNIFTSVTNSASITHNSYYSTPASLYLSLPYTGGYIYASTPMIDPSIPINGLRVDFRLKVTSGDTIYVGVMSNPTDTSTFELVSILTVTSLSFQNVGVNFNTYTGDGSYITIKTKKKYNIDNVFPSYIYIDNFRILTIPTCATPINLNVTNITDTSATLKWTEANDAYIWNIEYGLVDFYMGTGTIYYNYLDTFVPINNLTPLTTYQFYVQAYCGSNSESLYSEPYSFTTECSPVVSLPWCESFDTYGTGSGIIPPCFRKISNTGISQSTGIVSNPNFSSPGSISMSFITSGNYNFIILSRFASNFNMNTLKTKFNLRCNTLADTLYIGVMSDISDISTFELVHKVTVSSINTFQDIEVLFDQYNGNGKLIAFKGVYQNSSSNIYIDNLTVDTIPYCPAPTNLIISGTTATSITIGFLQHGTATGWEIEYGSSGFSHGTGTIIQNVTTNPFTINGLTPATGYQIYIRSVCNNSTNISWSLPVFGTTGCATISSLPWNESFDTYGTSGSFPTCWNKGSNMGSGPTITNTYYSSPGSLLFSTYNYYYSYATTPFLANNIPIDSVFLKFKLRTSYITDTIQIGVMSNPSDSGTFIRVATIGNPTYFNWYDHEVYFINYSGNGHYLAFKSASQSASSLLFLDNVVVEFAPTCIKPNNLTFSEIGGDSAVVNWNVLDNPTSYIIEYGTSGFSHGNGTQINVTTNPLTISGLNPSTNYDLYIRSVCSQTDTSDWSEKGTFCTTQLPALIPYNMDFETPSGFQFSNLSTGNGWYEGTAANNTFEGTRSLYVSNNNGLSNTYTTTTANVVWAYRDIYFAPSTTDYILTIDWKCQGEILYNTKMDYLKIYVGNGVTPTISTNSTINVPEGAVLIGGPLNMQENWESEDFIIPNALCSGAIKRLFFCWRNDASGGTQPPIAIDNLYLTSDGIISCITPTGLTVSNITDHTAIINWIPGDNETMWQLEYRPNGSSIWTTQNISGTPTSLLSNLENDTYYNVRVKSICNPGESNYTSVLLFTTLEFVYYSITASASPGGTITPSGEVIVQSGYSRTFEITPDQNTVIFSLLIDNEPITPQTTYTFSNVSENHFIHAEFIFDGIEESELQNSVLLIPNPAHQVVEISFQDMVPKETKAQFFNIYGQLIQEVYISEQKRLIDISELSSGIYIVRITTTKGTFNLKLIKR